jgi:hypothetical protein
MECKNHKLEFVRRYKSNGNKMLTKQCLSCGESLGGQHKLNLVDNYEKLPMFSEELLDNFYKTKYIVSQENRRKEFIEQKEKWFEEVYTPYLKSNKWKIKREAVLLRDKYLCQACLRNKANQVHHLTYNNVLDEPLFELISICEPCHIKLHNKNKNYEN